MKITADTNVLVRLLMADDAAQNAIAVRTVEEADTVAIGVHSFCELAWVLHRHYGVPRPDIARAIRQLSEARNVVINRPPSKPGSRFWKPAATSRTGPSPMRGDGSGATPSSRSMRRR